MKKFPFLFDKNIRLAVKFYFQIEEGKNKDVLIGIWLEFGLAF